MTPLPTPAGAARLRAAIAREREALARAAARVEIARARSTAAGSTFIEHTALGKALDDVYQAAERIFRSIAKAFEGVPEGSEWHAELLENMRTAVPALRPPGLALATVSPLRELLGFRHRFRNLYGGISTQRDSTRYRGRFPTSSRRSAQTSPPSTRSSRSSQPDRRIDGGRIPAPLFIATGLRRSRRSDGSDPS